MNFTPVEREQIKKACKEYSNSKTRQQAESDFQKELFAKLLDEIGIPKKVSKKLADTYHKQTFVQQQVENEEYEALYETIFSAELDD